MGAKVTGNCLKIEKDVWHLDVALAVLARQHIPL